MAIEKGYDVIAENFRDTVRSEVSVSQYCWKYITGSIGDNLIPRPPVRWCCIDSSFSCIRNLYLHNIIVTYD